jgi:hypothetical protein
MADRLDPQTARFLFGQLGTWYGPPRIVYGGAGGTDNRLIDGRIRFREAVAHGLEAHELPAVRATTKGQVARLLCVVGHYERARDWIPTVLTTPAEVAAFCQCRAEVVAPLCRRRRSPMQAHTTPRRRAAIEGIARLLREAEQGNGSVTADQIRRVLGPWL